MSSTQTPSLPDQAPAEDSGHVTASHSAMAQPCACGMAMLRECVARPVPAAAQDAGLLFWLAEHALRRGATSQAWMRQQNVYLRQLDRMSISVSRTF